MSYVELQSGFLAKKSDLLVTPNEYDKFYTDNILAKTFKQPSNMLYFCKDLSLLYRKYLADRTLINDFEFREDILVLAKKLFDEKNFLKWLELQVTKANLTTLHTTFIYDTLNFLDIAYDGDDSSIYRSKREIEAVQWISLLERNLESDSVKLDISKYFNKTQRNVVNYLPHKLNTILILWLNKNNGFEDLLTSLFVIFGDRAYITDVKLNPI